MDGWMDGDGWMEMGGWRWVDREIYMDGDGWKEWKAGRKEVSSPIFQGKALGEGEETIQIKPQCCPAVSSLHVTAPPPPP